MGREFVEFPAALDGQIRAHVASYCNYPQATSPEATELRGTPLSFYARSWLAYLEPKVGQTSRYYFLVQVGWRGQKLQSVIPIANAMGAIDRANRELKLSLKPSNVIDYLNFYYSFTPKDDPLVPGKTQFAAPRAFSDLVFKEQPTAAADQGQSVCKEECLALGAVWHYLDPKDRRNFAVLRCKSRKLPVARISGRACVQLENAVFAADFRLPAATGVPVLSNPELLYESEAVEPPEELPGRLLPIPSYILRREKWLRLKNWINSKAANLVRHTGLVLSWVATIAFLALAGLSVTFPVFEAFELARLRTLLEWISDRLGLQGWPTALFGLTTISILTVVWLMYYRANIDKVFNWMLRLCPRSWQRRLANRLDPLIEKHDRDLIAQDTFFKRARLALRLLTISTIYMVLAFASLQIALDVPPPASQSVVAWTTIWNFGKQAALNVPLIVYVMVRHPKLFGPLDPSEILMLDEKLVFLFHLAMAAIIIKGVYRIWIFTKEASPRVFYRKLTTRR